MIEQPPPGIAEIEKRVAELERRVDELESEPDVVSLQYAKYPVIEAPE